MRTTVTLDPDVEAHIRGEMERRGVSFKQALNDAIRLSINPQPRVSRYTTPRSMGVPSVNLDNALKLAADIEDEEMIRRMRTGQ